MSRAWVLDEPITRLTDVLSEQGIRLVSVAASMAIFGITIAPSPYNIAAIASASAIMALVIFAQLFGFMQLLRGRASLRTVERLYISDPTPTIVTGRDGEVCHANPAAQKRFKASEQDTLAQSFADVFANPAGVLNKLQQNAASLGGAHEDVVTRHGYMRLIVVALGEAHFLWRFEEVTEERSSARSAEGLALPMMIAATSGTILFMNETMRALVGSRAKHLNRILTDLPLRPDGIHEVTTLEGKVRHRVAVLDSGEGHREIFLFPIADGLQPQNTANGFEDLPVGLLGLDPDGTIKASNRLARKLFAVEEHELVGISLIDRLEGLGRPVRDWIEDAANGRGLGKPEVLRVSADGVETYLQITLGRASGLGDIGLVAVLNDATEMKSLEAQFVQSQKMQAIGQLAGGVAHDFNNLLTAISGHCDLMLLRHDEGDPDYGDLVQIHQNANRAASLVGQLLAFSRKQTLQPKIIDLRDTLADLTHLLNRLVGERVTLSLNHAPGLPTIRADRRQLEQVIMNLIVNARDAMPDGGEIKIETMERVLVEDMRRDRARVPAGRYVVVKVEDRGTGVPPEQLAKIFEPFYTTKRTGEGTGLGLSTAYGIVKQSGGFIFVDSVVGAGTNFTLYFPVYDKPLESDQTERSDVIPPKAVAHWKSRHKAYSASGNAAVALVDPPDAVSQSWSEEPKASPKPETHELKPLEAVSPSDITEVGENVVAWRQQAASTSPMGSASTETNDTVPSTEGVVLLVEDEAPVRAFASRALRMRGYTVIEAENAEEALKTLEDPLLQVDVFVTDVIMPGMDGPTWVRKALEARPHVKVVFVSGYAEDSFGDEQARIANSVFLPKPFSLTELTAIVQDQFH